MEIIAILLWRLRNASASYRAFEDALPDVPSSIFHRDRNTAQRTQQRERHPP